MQTQCQTTAHNIKKKELDKIQNGAAKILTGTIKLVSIQSLQY